MDDLAKHFRILEIKPGASWTEVRRAYRDLVQVWHPDRFAASDRLSRRAEARLGEINEAYQYLGRIHAAGGWDDIESMIRPATGGSRSRGNGTPAARTASESARPAELLRGPALDFGRRIKARISQEWLILLLALVTAALIAPWYLLWGLGMLVVIGARVTDGEGLTPWGVSVIVGFTVLGGGLVIAGTASTWATDRGFRTVAGQRVVMSQVAAGSFRACGVAADGIYCWGAPLLPGATTPPLCEGGRRPDCAGLPGLVAAGSFRRVVVGFDHACSLDTDGVAACWGQGFAGQLGTGAGEDRQAPTSVAADSSFYSLTAKGQHTCALTAVGTAFCWGNNRDGQLGHPAASETCHLDDTPFSCGFQPLAVVGPYSFRSIEVGVSHTCGLTREGEAVCWGSNRSGQLGYSSETCLDETGSHACSVRAQPASTEARFSMISAGAAHTCALTADGRPWCWGRNDSGQLGLGHTSDTAEPKPLPVSPSFSTIEAGAFHTCGLTTDGLLYCWGRNLFGELGLERAASHCGRVGCELTPKPAQSRYRFAFLSAGFDFTCGGTIDGEQFCWGRNDVGQWGNGSHDALEPAYTPATERDAHGPGRTPSQVIRQGAVRVERWVRVKVGRLMRSILPPAY
jgi:alpha-tubulin suppressor-like RCC1 family protein